MTHLLPNVTVRRVSKDVVYVHVPGHGHLGMNDSEALQLANALIAAVENGVVEQELTPIS
jgi:hypothetical protein